MTHSRPGGLVASMVMRMAGPETWETAMIAVTEARLSPPNSGAYPDVADPARPQ